jgi:mutator protein MutT
MKLLSTSTNGYITMQHSITKKVIASIICKEDKVLIAQRAKKDEFYGKWEFPGGKMEEGETEKECLARELSEDLGIQAEIGDYLCSSFFEHKGSPMEMRTYYVPSYAGDIKLYDHQEVRWVHVQDLPSYDMPDPDKPIVEKLLKQLDRS